ncbi:MAG TPA: FkbM family methyltransferase [Vineibacter sp.]|nr:FkbM family methyltransferase [Vineibacter sp.]
MTAFEQVGVRCGAFREVRCNIQGTHKGQRVSFLAAGSRISTLYRAMRGAARAGERFAASLSWPALIVLGLALLPMAAIAVLALPLLAAVVPARVMVGAIWRKSRRRVLAGSGEVNVITDIGGRSYRLTSDDAYLYRVEGKFEPGTVRLLSALVRPEDTVFDVGASIGCTSLLFGARAARVFSFEPSADTFRYLQHNLAAAGSNNVTAVNAGLGDVAGTFELVFAPTDRSGGFVADRLRAPGGHKIEQVRILRGDDFVVDNAIAKVDLIKIDVEGFERHVIAGLEATLARDRPVVVLELNHWCLNAFRRTSLPDFLDFLRGVFPVLYAVEATDFRDLHDRDQSYHVMHHHIVHKGRYQNIVAAFARDRLAGLEPVQRR